MAILDPENRFPRSAVATDRHRLPAFLRAAVLKRIRT